MSCYDDVSSRTDHEPPRPPYLVTIPYLTVQQGKEASPHFGHPSPIQRHVGPPINAAHVWVVVCGPYLGSRLYSTPCRSLLKHGWTPHHSSGRGYSCALFLLFASAIWSNSIWWGDLSPILLILTVHAGTRWVYLRNSTAGQMGQSKDIY